MKYLNNDIVFQIPIRYWETQEPIECTVIGDQSIEVHTSGQFNSHSLYVNHGEYGHAVYINPDDIFYSKEKAIKVAKLRKQILKFRSRDETNQVLHRVMPHIY